MGVWGGGDAQEGRVEWREELNDAQNWWMQVGWEASIDSQAQQ